MSPSRKKPKLDVAYIQLRKGAVHKSMEMRPGIIFDFDKNGEVVGIEVLSLKKIAQPLATDKKSSRQAA